MVFTIYVHLKCSTCQKAILFLEQQKIIYKAKDITKTAPTLEELQFMLTHTNGNVKKLFNTSGILYRELQISQKLPNMSLDQALDLLTQNGMLVKRPFLIGNHIGILGFREQEWLKALCNNLVLK